MRNDRNDGNAHSGAQSCVKAHGVWFTSEGIAVPHENFSLKNGSLFF